MLVFHEQSLHTQSQRIVIQGPDITSTVKPSEPSYHEQEKRSCCAHKGEHNVVGPFRQSRLYNVQRLNAQPSGKALKGSTLS